jgi:formylglycine-generating enzyme required for sulfatase activity
MADLAPSLFKDVERWLRPYLMTRDQRAVALTHLLSQWPERTALRWEAPADAFTAELVELLPNAMLTEVLRAVGDGQGVEQRRAAAELCARVDAAGALARHGPLPAVRLKPAPTRQPDDGGSVLFLAPDPTAEPEMTLSVEAIRAAWREPLALVTDFPLDAELSLAALADAGEPVLWIAGESLLAPDPPERFAGADDARKLADLPPSLLLVDFSAVRPESAYDEQGRVAELLQALLAWAETKGHRVALGLPRYVLPHLDLDSPHRWSGHVYRAAELFSHRYAHHAERCERLLKAALPLREVLFPLLSANSVSLSRHAAELLARTSRRRPRTEPDEIALAIRIARGLVRRGFYEIAYRLEVYCRTRSARTGFVPLAADLWPAPGREKDPVVGFVASSSELPARVRRATLTGPTGVGKTTALVDIEHRWSVPRNGEPGEWISPYLPLYVSLSGDAVGLRRRIDDHIARDEFRWFGYGDERFELDCHALVGRLGSLEAMRHLFGSPVLLLLDDADQVPADTHEELGRDLAALHDTGLLLASRSEHMGRMLRLNEVRIRELDEQQVSLFLKQRRGHPSLLDLLAAHDRPIAHHVRNPQLLSLLCELDLTAGDLVDANLKTIIEQFVTRQANGSTTSWAAGEHAKRLAAWLPGVAHELLMAHRQQRRATTPEERTLVADARLFGLLRGRADRDLIEFSFETLKDYFAAQWLDVEIGRSGVGPAMEPYLRQAAADDLLGEWRDACRIVVALLRVRDARKLVELLARFDPRLAHECALELPAEQSQVGATTARILERRIVPERDVDDRVEDARALGGHDPRINVDAPLDRMVEVPASERLSSYRIGKYPVTTMEFAQFVAERGYRTEDWWSPAGWAWVQKHRIAFPQYWRNHVISRPNHPVTGVNFFEASAYCAWLTNRHRGLVFRLPSGLEWDRAAHSDDYIFQLVLDIAVGASVPNGRQPARRGRDTHPAVRASKQLLNGTRLEDLEVVGPDSREEIARAQRIASAVKKHLATHEEQLRYETLTPVGVFARNGLGIYDLFGGAWQWCNTSISQVSPTERQFEDLTDNPSVADGVPVVVKGGGSSSGFYNPVWLLIGGWFDPLVRSHRLGFRVTCRTRTDR